MEEQPRSLKLVAPELLESLLSRPSLALDDERLKALRSFVMPAVPLAPELDTVRCDERFIPGPQDAPDVRVLVYRPDAARATGGAYLHMHGGGFVLGAPEIADAANRALVVRLGIILVSVDYRLAPETRHPGPVEDCYAALAWMHEQADALGIDRGRIAIGGESAGAGHAASLARLARDRGDYAIRLQLLDAPMLDDRTGATSDPHPYCGELVWTPAQNRFGWRALLGVEPGSADVPVEAVPARALSLGGLPPAFIMVGALDLFLEEDLDYARRLVRAGVATELHVIPGAYHGFGAAGPSAPQVAMAQRLRQEALARALA